jgi:hypothetical protein
VAALPEAPTRPVSAPCTALAKVETTHRLIEDVRIEGNEIPRSGGHGDVALLKRRREGGCERRRSSTG